MHNRVKEATKWKEIINTVIITIMSTCTPTNTCMNMTIWNIAMNTCTPMRMGMITNTATCTATKKTHRIMGTGMQENMARTTTIIPAIKRSRMIIATNRVRLDGNAKFFLTSRDNVDNKPCHK